MKNDSKIFVAGHRGLVGSAIIRRLESEGFFNIIVRSRAELDLKRQSDVEAFFETERPEYVFLAGAKVGGIAANATYPAEFIYDNLVIQSNVIHSAYLAGVKKLAFLGSSCIYPKLAQQALRLMRKDGCCGSYQMEAHSPEKILEQYADLFDR